MIGRGALVAYALPALALSLPTIPAYVYLPGLYAERVGLASTAAILFAVRMADILADPLVGWVADRWGQRKALIAVGAPIAGIGLVCLFTPGAGTGPAQLALWALALYVGWSMVAIPYQAWGADLATGYDARSAVAFVRELAGLAGILAAGILPVVVTRTGGDLAASVAAVAWAGIAIGVPAFLLLLLVVPERRRAPAQPVGPAAMLQVFRNQPFLRLMVAWSGNGLANGLAAALFPLFLRHRLEASESDTALAMLLYFLAGILAVPFWLWLSRRVGKHRAWCVAMLCCSAAFVWAPLLGPGAIGWFLAICVVTGATLGADLALPSALQADVLDYDRWRFRTERSGLMFALWTMATKLAAGAAVGLGLGLLAAAGFSTDGGNDEWQLTLLALIYGGLPVVIKLSVIGLIWRYRITARAHRALSRRLAVRMRCADI